MNYPDLVRKVLAEGRVKYYETLSSGISMFPTIWPNSTLRAQYVPLGEIKRGDIIIFQRRDRLVAHRVVETRQDYVRTQGDSCRIKDEVVNANNYLCKVVEFVLFKKITFSEKSIFWRIQKWYFLNVPWSHVLNNVVTMAAVKIVLLFRKK